MTQEIKKTQTSRLPKKRTYNSRLRKEQAALTKKSIADAALKLIQSQGYSGLTLEGVAKEAGVSTQTVYAVCGSKKGILAAILENTVEALNFDTLRDTIPTIKGAKKRIHEVARFMYLINSEALNVFNVMRAISMLSPDFAEQELDQNMMILDKCLNFIHAMAQENMLRSGLSEERAAQLFWLITSQGIHRHITKTLQWSGEEYIKIIEYMLETILIGTTPPFPFLDEKKSPKE